MAKLFTYLIIISFITLGLYFCTPDVTVSEITLLDNLIHPESYTEISFYKEFISVGLKGFFAAIATLFVGYVMSRPDLAVTAGITTYIGMTYFSALYTAHQKIASAGIPVLTALSWLFIGTTLIAGCVVLIDWWRGRD